MVVIPDTVPAVLLLLDGHIPYVSSPDTAAPAIALSIQTDDFVPVLHAFVMVMDLSSDE